MNWGEWSSLVCSRNWPSAVKKLFWGQKCEVTYFSSSFILREMQQAHRQRTHVELLQSSLHGLELCCCRPWDSTAGWRGSSSGARPSPVPFGARLSSWDGGETLVPEAGSCLQPTDGKIRHTPTVPAAQGKRNLGNHTLRTLLPQMGH